MAPCGSVCDCHERCWDAAWISYHATKSQRGVRLLACARGGHFYPQLERERTTQPPEGTRRKIHAWLLYWLPWFAFLTSLVSFTYFPGFFYRASLVCFTDFPGLLFWLPWFVLLTYQVCFADFPGLLFWLLSFVWQTSLVCFTDFPALIYWLPCFVLQTSLLWFTDFSGLFYRFPCFILKTSLLCFTDFPAFLFYRLPITEQLQPIKTSQLTFLTKRL